MLSRGVIASAPLRMGGAGTSGAHSLASSIVSLVIFIVSFVFISLIVMMSLRTVATMMVSGMHNVWMMHVAREQWDMASAFALQLCARWLSSGPADSQPVASDTRNHRMLLTCERMLLCECMCASLARLACGQRVRRACCARVCSCARRRAASVGEACEAKAGQARCATCLRNFYPRVKIGIFFNFARVKLTSRRARSTSLPNR